MALIRLTLNTAKKQKQTNLFIHFWRESTACQSAYGSIWPLGDKRYTMGQGYFQFFDLPISRLWKYVLKICREIYEIGILMCKCRDVAREGGQGAREFGRSVNPIQKGRQIMPLKLLPAPLGSKSFVHLWKVQMSLFKYVWLWLHCVRIEVMKIKWGVLWQFFDQTTVSRPLCSISYSMWTPRGVPSIFYHHTHLIWLLTKEAKLHSFWKKNMRWENETPCGLTFWQKTQQVCRVVGI